VIANFVVKSTQLGVIIASKHSLKQFFYHKMLLESELNSARNIQNVEAVRSIALSEREPVPSSYPELDGVMLEEELPSSSTMDQY